LSENNLFEAIDTIVSEKNITKEDIAQELSESIKKTYCYFFNYEGELTVDVNFNNKNISFIKSRKIVNTVVDSDLEISISEVSKIDRNNKQEVDEVFEEVIPFSVFPRLQILKICQSFKQGILKLQKEYIYNEYLSRKGEILVGIVESVESYNYIINLGNNTAILPHKLKIPGEQFNVGDKIKFYVLDIFTFPSSNFGQILASRSNYEFLVSLFTSEIPEIQQKNVSIKKVA
jgi:N utilization substance protein A